MNYTEKNKIEVFSKETGFLKNPLEKQLKLYEFLSAVFTDDFLKNKVVLKGGTAINMLNKPLLRLSLDIDLDVTVNFPKEEMNEYKGKINQRIKTIAVSKGYICLDNSRLHYALSSLVFTYESCFGCLDQLKLDVNFMDREHILPIENVNVINPFTKEEFIIRVLNPYELFGTKISALVSRALPRDLYDVYHMIVSSRLPDSNLLKKCAVFYQSISGRDNADFKSFEKIESVNWRRNRQYLTPVLRRDDNYDFAEAKKIVIDYMVKDFVLNESETKFVECFQNQVYKPELLFDDKDILSRIVNHPMALWRCLNKAPL